MQMNKMNAKEFFIKNIIVNENDFNKYIISKFTRKILQKIYCKKHTPELGRDLTH